ncbi:hypothetical protein MUK42_19666 [Musa troglodytarum]|uniref:Uncharacterized protein n=1 Tax=Musa troglodytarum TaxID=320322 RepID=A0A9E7ETM2_9LILI|nr:hypothetical protein MUK42_19666 [Musa troglodytarum]
MEKISTSYIGCSKKRRKARREKGGANLSHGRNSSRCRGIQVFLDFLEVVVVSWRKSRRTALLHLGHLGSSPGSMTYMRQRGQPASTIDGPSGLSASDDRQELGEDDPRGESSPPVVAILLEVSPLVGNARFSFRSSFWLSPWPLRLLILLLLWQKQPTSSNTTTVRTPRRAAGSTDLLRRSSTRPEAEEGLLWNLHHHELPMPFYRQVEGGFSIGDIIALH